MLRICDSVTLALSTFPTNRRLYSKTGGALTPVAGAAGTAGVVAAAGVAASAGAGAGLSTAGSALLDLLRPLPPRRLCGILNDNK